MTSVALYPWQLDAAERWLAQSTRMAHAWLIHGQMGIGKTHFAHQLACVLLCENNPERRLYACGQCAACVWMQGNNHPDFLRVRPQATALDEGEEASIESADTAKKAPSKEILVDQIRQMETWALTGAHRSGQKIIMLYPAEALNTIAANALLKLLEEPPPGVVFFLISDQMDRLLPTIISRCRRLALPMPSKASALDWLHQQGVIQADLRLAAAGGAPVAAWRSAQSDLKVKPDWLSSLVQTWSKQQACDLVALVETIENTGVPESHAALQRVLFDVLLVTQGIAPRFYMDFIAHYQAWAQHIDIKRLQTCLRDFSSEKRHINHPLNPKLRIQVWLQKIENSCLK